MQVDFSILMALISMAAALSGVVLGWSGRSREVLKETRKEAEMDATIRTDVEYIKRGIDAIRLEQRAQGQRVDTLTERVARLEESVKQAHKRLDYFEKKEEA
jgi:uncharacterized membrane protein